MAVVSVDYNDRPLQYLGVSINGSRSPKRTWASGDFPRDWYQMIKAVVAEQITPVLYSSSVEQWLRDNRGKYESAYLDMSTGKPVLIYKCTDEKIEFFVPRGERPTWEQLRNKYE